MDITPPPLGNVYVYGELLFEDVQDYNFTAHVVSLLTNIIVAFVGVLLLLLVCCYCCQIITISDSHSRT